MTGRAAFLKLDLIVHVVFVVVHQQAGEYHPLLYITVIQRQIDNGGDFIQFVLDGIPVHIQCFCRTGNIVAADQIIKQHIQQIGLVLAVIAVYGNNGRMSQVNDIIVPMLLNIMLNTEINDIVGTVIFVMEDAVRQIFPRPFERDTKFDGVTGY